MPFMKFKGTLFSQKVTLTDEEYDTLISAFAQPLDKNLINYVAFNDHIERIFVEKNLEKEPTKQFTQFHAPSILDPQDVLNDAEETVLEKCLTRIGVHTNHRRLLMKPYFQDKVSSYLLFRTSQNQGSWPTPDSDRSSTS
jgi:hypothetical protein